MEGEGTRQLGTEIEHKETKLRTQDRPPGSYHRSRNGRKNIHGWLNTKVKKGGAQLDLSQVGRCSGP